MPKSVEKYTEERNELLQKLYNILGVNETNRMFSLKELDKNEQKQQAIIDLVPEIKKYFLCSRWNYFNNKDRECKRIYLSLIKAFFKNMNIKMNVATLVKKNDDNTSKYETFYIL